MSFITLGQEFPFNDKTYAPVLYKVGTKDNIWKELFIEVEKINNGNGSTSFRMDTKYFASEDLLLDSLLAFIDLHIKKEFRIRNFK